MNSTKPVIFLAQSYCEHGLFPLVHDMHTSEKALESLTSLCRRTLEKAGPAFIKWGQWAATRKDMFPADFCKVMESLHKNAPSHTLAATRSAIQRAFSQSMEELFEDFQVEPVASGSIGQVYKARLSEEAAAYAGLRSGEACKSKNMPLFWVLTAQCVDADFG